MILRGAENIYPGLYEPALHVPGVELARAGRRPGRRRRRAARRRGAAAPRRRPRGGARRPARPAAAGWARPGPTRCCFAEIPLAGRSRKPDRAAAARLAARRDRAAAWHGRPRRARRRTRPAPVLRAPPTGVAARPHPRPAGLSAQPPGAVRAARRHAAGARSCGSAGTRAGARPRTAYVDALTRVPLDRTAAGTTGGAARAALAGSRRPAVRPGRRGAPADPARASPTRSARPASSGSRPVWRPCSPAARPAGRGGRGRPGRPGARSWPGATAAALLGPRRRPAGWPRPPARRPRRRPRAHHCPGPRRPGAPRPAAAPRRRRGSALARRRRRRPSAAAPRCSRWPRSTPWSRRCPGPSAWCADDGLWAAAADAAAAGARRRAAAGHRADARCCPGWPPARAAVGRLPGARAATG